MPQADAPLALVAVGRTVNLVTRLNHQKFCNPNPPTPPRFQDVSPEEARSLVDEAELSQPGKVSFQEFASLAVLTSQHLPILLQHLPFDKHCKTTLCP